MDAPRTSVRGYLAKGRFEDVSAGILISDIDLEVRNTDAGGLRALLAAKDGQNGSLAVEADITGLRGKDAAPEISLRGQAHSFHPLRRGDLDLTLSGILGARGPLIAPALTAEIVVDQGEILLSSRMGGASVPVLPVEEKRSEGAGEPAGVKKEHAGETTGPTLDARIVLPRRLYVRGMGLDSEWQGELRAKGPASVPVLGGSLRPVRGYLDLFSRAFTFSGGDITFGGGAGINPSINLELTHESPAITAIIRAGGTAKKPRLRLESRPPLPQDEVLSAVLFGKRSSELSRIEAIQLADNMRTLTGAGGNSLDVLTGLRGKFGLDMLRLGGGQKKDGRGFSGREDKILPSGAPGSSGADSDDSSLPSIEAGKYINDNIYVGVEQGAASDATAVRVEVDLGHGLTLEGTSSSTAGEAGIGWKIDY